MREVPEAPTATLFIVDLDAGREALFDYAARCGALGEDDEKRVGRLRDADAGKRLRAAYAGLRFALEKVFGPDVRGRDLTRPKGGKPSLDGLNGDFSLAHSGNLALIGVTTTGIIGVDIEFQRKTSMPDARRVQIIAAGDVLDGRLLRYGSLVGGELRNNGATMFQRAWVRLEAFAKAHGIGIGRVLTELGIIGSRDGSAGADKRMQVFSRQKPSLDIYDVEIGDGVVGCIALSAGIGEPTILRLPTTVLGLRAFTASAPVSGA